MKKTLFLVLSLVMVISFFAVTVPITATATDGTSGYTVRDTNVSTPSDGCLMLGLKGSYLGNAKNALDRINEIRYEACAEGVQDPRNSNRSLTLDDYVPIKWSQELEMIAKIRAVEASITIAHARLNGKSIWSTTYGDLDFYGEVLAWNFSSNMVYGVNQWYDEKEDWVNQNAGTVTGHYTQMIDPSNTYVGLGSFVSNDTYYRNCTAGSFSDSCGDFGEEFLEPESNVIQKLEVLESKINKYELQLVDEIPVGTTLKLGENVNVQATIKGGYSVDIPLLSFENWAFTSSDTSIATFEDGELKGLKQGTAIITATLNDNTLTKEFTVGHNPVTTSTTTKATLSSDGKIVKTTRCKNCNEVLDTTVTTIYKPAVFTLSSTSYLYDGTVKKPTVSIKDSNGSTISASNYSVTYSDASSSAAGTYSVTVKFKGNYSGTKVLEYKISKLATPTVTASNVNAGISVKWNKISKAAGYYVYRKTSSTGWSKIATIKSASTVSYTDPKAVSGTSYYYTVRAYNGSAKSSYKSSAAIICLSSQTAKVRNATTGVKVSWNKVKGAKGYYVYRKTSTTGWSKIATIKTASTVSYTDTKVVSGTSYYYTVRAYNGIVKSSYKSSPKILFLKAYKPTVKNTSKGINITCPKTVGASAYYIYRKTGSTGWSKIATVFAGETKVSYTDTKAVNGTTYYYTVKAFDGYHQGAYISSDAIKCKR
ncbi:MAG: CAP domain-containing protein [Acutalibacteraceae bacterium]